MFLRASDEEFESGEELQASEKLWGAAAHAVMAVVGRENDGAVPNSHGALREAAEELSRDRGDAKITLGFSSASRLHRNFYHRILVS